MITFYSAARRGGRINMGAFVTTESFVQFIRCGGGYVAENCPKDITWRPCATDPIVSTANIWNRSDAEQNERQIMKLPTSKQLGELSQSDRELLGKFYDTFSSHPWFESAMIVCSHPETLAEKTLEVHCLYHSSFSHPSMKHFAKENGLALYTVLPRCRRTSLQPE